MSPRMPRITALELLRALRRGGWETVGQHGSHVQLRHPDKHGRVTVPQHTGKTIPPAVLKSVLDQSGLSIEQLQELL